MATIVSNSVSPDLAMRLARALAQAPGVESATVCGPEGNVLGTASAGDATREGALATFVAGRAEALSTSGDLRGMGRLVNDGHLQQVVASWPGGEALILVLGECRVFIALRRGIPAESTAPALRAIALRYS